MVIPRLPILVAKVYCMPLKHDKRRIDRWAAEVNRKAKVLNDYYTYSSKTFYLINTITEFLNRDFGKEFF